VSSDELCTASESAGLLSDCSTTDDSPALEPPALKTNYAIDNKALTAPPRSFTTPVVLIIIGYGILAYHTITFDSLLPVFLSTPPSGTPPSPPFHFVGGFGMSTKDIGLIMTLQGVYSIIATVVFFPWAARALGPLHLFRLLALTYPLLYLVTPYLVLVPTYLRPVGIAVIIVWKCTYANFAFPANAILLTNAAPSTLVLGTINGVAASTASLARAFGPTISGALYAAGLRIGFGPLVWWVTALMTVFGAVIGFAMKDAPGRMDVADNPVLTLEVECEEALEPVLVRQ
jgi:hypothetical protein